MVVETDKGRTGGRLYIVGTPIGNLDDLSARAAAAFESADAICCEDTRVTSKLLAHLGVSKPLVRCDENVIASRAPQLVERLLAGEALAFASDAGMPGVSDPGQVLVDAARDAGVAVEVIPGPTACITALVATGIPCDHFFFEGFLPRKHGERVRRLRRLAAIPGALLFYESPHRVEDSLAAIAEVFPEREVAVCRELTKLHEEVFRGPAADVRDEFARRAGEGSIKGEIVLVIDGPSEAEAVATAATAASDASSRAAELVAEGMRTKEVAKKIAAEFGIARNEAYEIAMGAGKR